MVAVTKFGSGAKVLVIHGGPGFNSNYLVEPLCKLSGQSSFVCYSQSYVESTLDGCSKELLNVIDQEFDENSLRVIAHSWGCLVLISALAQQATAGQIRNRHLKAILINPVPITKQLFDESVAAFQQSIPSPVIEAVMQLALSSPDGSEAMAKLLPYYVSNQDVCNTLALPLSFAAYQSVLSSLPEFDFSSALSQLADSHVLLGDKDITPHHTIENILRASRDVEIISGTGHFPLHESPERALQVVANWLD